MTRILERSLTRKPVSWVSVLGLVLIPVLVAGTFVAALWSPFDQLSQVKAAIVNNDEPVTVNDQTVPLGRSLAGGLMDSENDQNFTWQLADKDAAADGLADGTYAAVVTIPKDFSAAATSTSDNDGATAKQAVIDVQTSDRGKLLDSALSQLVTQQAVATLNTTLTQTYLENVYVGFDTLGTELGKASEGAAQLADGAKTLEDGLGQSEDGAQRLADGTTQLVDGVGEIATNLRSASGGVATANEGSAQLLAGADPLAEGAGQLATGLESANTGASELASGAGVLSDGLTDYAEGLKTFQSGLQQLSDACLESGGAAEYCAQLAGVTSTLSGTADQPGLVPVAEQLAGGAGGVAEGAATLSNGINSSLGGAQSLATGTQTLRDGLVGLNDGLGTASSGIDQLATGAETAASNGAPLPEGAQTLADGLSDAKDGAGKLQSGASDLADGLDQAVSSVPKYENDTEREKLAEVVTTPVTSGKSVGDIGDAFGQGSVAYFIALALWLGALAVYLVLQAISRRTLGTTDSSTILTLRGFLPGAVILAAQGLLLSIVMQFALSLDPGRWLALAAVSMLIGVVFAAVNQALVAVFGGFGRWVSVAFVTVTAAASIVSAVPGFFQSAPSWLPTTAAYEAALAVINGTSISTGLTGLLVWFVAALVATLIAVARKRMVTVNQLGVLQDA